MGNRRPWTSAGAGVGGGPPGRVEQWALTCHCLCSRAPAADGPVPEIHPLSPGQTAPAGHRLPAPASVAQKLSAVPVSRTEGLPSSVVTGHLAPERQHCVTDLEKECLLPLWLPGPNCCHRPGPGSHLVNQRVETISFSRE